MMKRHARKIATGFFLTVAGLGGVADDVDLDRPISEYRDRTLAESAREPGVWDDRAARAAAAGVREPVVKPVSAQAELPPRVALPTDVPMSQPSLADVLAQIPDPVDADRVFAERLAHIETTARERRVVNNYRRVMEKAREYLVELALSRKKTLSLAECVQRALTNNYTIRVASFEPAIGETQVVEAEAAFDAIFFLDASHANNDSATASQLADGQSDIRDYRGGFRQLLPTGMRTELSVGQRRIYTDSQFSTLNPAYDSTFQASFTQPLLRGFGLDYNRAAITIARSNQRISEEQFLGSVREQVLAVERAYWDLVSARRTVAILAESVAQNYVTKQNIWERREHDATPVEIANSQSRFSQRWVAYIDSVRLVREAEDALKNLLNDPELLMSAEIEIIPTETPLLAAVTLDQFAEVRTALEQRNEIREARERIEQARVNTMRAKNETMPNLDLSFTYEVQGIGRGADPSFDNMTTNRFRSYSVGVQFSVPLGQRAAYAGLRRSRMQESQAIVALQQAMDGIVQQVNTAVRQLVIRYRQIPPQYDAAINADRNLRALQERTEVINPAFLQTELTGVEDLANTRRNLLQVVLDYNVGLVELESAKGTLLRYNNVVVSDTRHRP